MHTLYVNVISIIIFYADKLKKHIKIIAYIDFFMKFHLLKWTTSLRLKRLMFFSLMV